MSLCAERMRAVHARTETPPPPRTGLNLFIAKRVQRQQLYVRHTAGTARSRDRHIADLRVHATASPKDYFYNQRAARCAHSLAHSIPGNRSHRLDYACAYLKRSSSDRLRTIITSSSTTRTCADAVWCARCSTDATFIHSTWHARI